MDLVFLYGPPASGKFTIGTALADKTGFKLFHNHLSRDLVTSLFPYGTPEFREHVTRVRLQMLEAAAAARLAGVVFTFVYERPSDDGFVASVCEAVERHGARVVFAQLACDRATLEKRVVGRSKSGFGKITTLSELAAVLSRSDCMSAVQGRESLRLDSARALPDENARTIAAHYALPIVDARVG